MKYLKLIPKSWDEVKVIDYLKLSELIDGDSESTDIVEAAFYVFTGVPMSDSNIKFDEVNAIVQRLLFISELPKESKSLFKTKKFSDLSYQEYINFQKLAESPIDNIIGIIKILSVEPIDEDKISMQKAMDCFFLVNRKMKKRLISLAISLMFKMMKLKIKTLFSRIFNKLKMKGNKNGVGY